MVFNPPHAPRYDLKQKENVVTLSENKKEGT